MRWTSKPPCSPLMLPRTKLWLYISTHFPKFLTMEFHWIYSWRKIPSHWDRIPSKISYCHASKRDPLMDLTCRTEGKPWKLDLPTIPDHPRNQAVATFRLSTGHDCLAKLLSSPNLNPATPLLYPLQWTRRYEQNPHHEMQCTQKIHRAWTILGS